MAITLDWDSKFEIGHERIDFEHRIFLGLIRDLSVDAEAADGRFDRTLREILKYAEFHFVSEENIMADVAYPALAEHRSLHAMLLAQLQDKLQRRGDRVERPDEIVDFLFQWFALHTTQEDRRIAAFIGKGDGRTRQ